MNILIAAHTPRHGTFVVGSHHLAREFAKMGHRILHLSPPITPLHLKKWRETTVRLRFKSATFSPRKDDQGDGEIYDWVPLSIMPLEFSLLRPKSGKGNLSLRSIINFHNGLLRSNFSKVDILIIDHPCFWGIWEFIEAKKIIYRPTDIYAAGYINQKPIKLCEKMIAERADAVIATSKPVLDDLSDIVKIKTRKVIENGVELDFFSGKAFDANKNTRIVTYCGAIDDRFSWDIVVDIAQGMPDIELHIYGEIMPSSRPPQVIPMNVKIMGPISYKMLPQKLKMARIALLPLVNSRLNEGRSPMKIYEYLASGLPVVSSMTKELSRRNIPGVILAKNSMEFIEAINVMLNGGWKFPESDLRPILLQSSWDYKAKDYLRFIDAIN